MKTEKTCTGCKWENLVISEGVDMSKMKVIHRSAWLFNGILCNMTIIISVMSSRCRCMSPIESRRRTRAVSPCGRHPYFCLK